jgi:hypothetical protein
MQHDEQNSCQYSKRLDSLLFFFFLPFKSSSFVACREWKSRSHFAYSLANSDDVSLPPLPVELSLCTVVVAAFARLALWCAAAALLARLLISCGNDGDSVNDVFAFWFWLERRRGEMTAPLLPRRAGARCVVVVVVEDDGTPSLRNASSACGGKPRNKTGIAGAVAVLWMCVRVWFVRGFVGRRLCVKSRCGEENVGV